MDAILQLLTPGNSSLAATLVLYSFVIAAGIYLGKIKVAGVSLGVTFVLFVGILMGHFGYIVDGDPTGLSAASNRVTVCPLASAALINASVIAKLFPFLRGLPVITTIFLPIIKSSVF